MADSKGVIYILTNPSFPEYVKMGKIETAAEHMPDYLRLSQAERERLEKEKEA